MTDPNSHEQAPRGAHRDGNLPCEPSGSEAVVPEHATRELLSEARKRFRELATVAVDKCELLPDKARAILHSLELGFAQIVKEDGPAMQAQFGQDAAAAVTWATGRLMESTQHVAADIPGRERSPLQNLAVLQVQALEYMLPELTHENTVEPATAGIPAAQLQTFCALLNDGLDLAQKAEAAARRRDRHAFRRHFELSRTKLRDAARLLRRMLRDAGSEITDLTIGLRGFQLELAAHTGNIRMFLKALGMLSTAAHCPQHRTQALNPHCLIEDLLPTLFHWHFEFTITTPPGIPTEKSQELVTAAHGRMWEKVEQRISAMLDEPCTIDPTAFRDTVEAELQQAIKDVNSYYAADHVVVSISSNNVREITRRQW